MRGNKGNDQQVVAGHGSELGSEKKSVSAGALPSSHIRRKAFIPFAHLIRQ